MFLINNSYVDKNNNQQILKNNFFYNILKQLSAYSLLFNKIYIKPIK